ncbi:reverse transcriptase SR3 [Labeo rohita]|uniref:Reverse transcriptase SR3 n=1 Tax=Labeo rohita TaxID=84645 RepID=A0A498M984_LABRO|nr:reverse transcriptase SR3 [Labeo rohita]
MQEKINVETFMSSQVGLNIHKDKTKILKVNTTTTEPITLNGISLKEVQSFTYLGSINRPAEDEQDHPQEGPDLR